MANILKVKVGDTYGRLTVVERAQSRKGRTYWKCRCSCGNMCEVSSNEMTRTDRPGSKSCGCLRAEVTKEVHSTHGMSSSPEFRTWEGMRVRCNNESHVHYNLYGGRGITYDKKWETFEGFYEDMGKRPSNGHTLDRIDNSKGYYKENCRWATKKEQSNNRSNNVRFLYKGKELTLPEISDETGVKVSTLHKRIREGLTAEEAVAAPVKKYTRTGVPPIRNARFEYKGESHTVSEWAKITGISIYTLHYRFSMGWDVERALTKRKA